MEPLFEIDPIIYKYVREEELSPAEAHALDEWQAGDQDRAEWLLRLKTDPDYTKSESARLQRTPNSRAWDQFESRLRKEGSWSDAPDSSAAAAIPITHPPSRGWWRLIVAATVLVAVAGTTWWALNRRSVSSPAIAPIQAATLATDVKPGGNRAVLTLSDGRQINLDSSTNGVLASQSNMNVTKLADGQLAYHKASNNKSSEEKPASPAFNRLSTPRAGQFSLTLPDGTQVWLNNASSLRYPVFFAGNTREVDLTGEAYFDVAKDAAHPFKVRIHKGSGADALNSGDAASEITVLGTSFNIMAYDDETTQRATLVEGSIQFSHNGHKALLKPEEQSVLDQAGKLQTLHDVNVEEITAWKNGFFHFDHSSLPSTMRQLARWYDVEVEYGDGIPEQEFMGKIQRNLPLSAVLKGLENEHVHFSVEGRRVVVRP